MTGDLASALVAGVDRFLLSQIEESTARRIRHWKRRLFLHAAYNASVEPNRQRLAQFWACAIRGCGSSGPQLVGTMARPDLLASAEKFNVFSVRWPAFGDVTGEGLLLEPGDHIGVASVVVIPDADQTPEQLVGLVAGRSTRNLKSRAGWPRAAAA